MLIPADIGVLLNFFSFTAWLFYGAVALALLILRYKWRDVHRPFKVNTRFTFDEKIKNYFNILKELITGQFVNSVVSGS